MQKGCPYSEKAVYADNTAWFGHYWRKGRNALIQLIQENEILRNPYIEPTYILANKLVQFSKIEQEEKKDETRTL